MKRRWKDRVWSHPCWWKENTKIYFNLIWEWVGIVIHILLKQGGYAAVKKKETCTYWILYSVLAVRLQPKMSCASDVPLFPPWGEQRKSRNLQESELHLNWGPDYQRDQGVAASCQRHCRVWGFLGVRRLWVCVCMFMYVCAPVWMILRGDSVG